MDEKLAIEILKQASLETTVGACEKCPRKDKNKTCIGCLDNAKCILLNYTDNLQSKIDKAIEYIENNIWEDEYGGDVIEDYNHELLKILKGDK